jgi:type II secretion system protein G
MNGGLVKKPLLPILFAGFVFVSLAVFYITNMQDSSPANQKQAPLIMKEVAIALKEYRNDCGKFPTESEGLAFLAGRDPNCSSSKEMYLKKMKTQDPWGNPFSYKIQADGTKFELVSFGRDGKPGGDGFDQDITWSE